MASLLLAAAVQPAFHYERPVVLAHAPAAETCVTLPADLLAHADFYLRDLRVYGDGREWPFLAYISSTLAVDEAKPQRILNLGERDGVVSFDVEITEPRYNRVVLHLARADYAVVAHVSGIQQPGQHGVVLATVALSANAGDEDAQARPITLPLSSFRYLHFELRTVALVPVIPAEIAGVDVVAKTSTPARYAVAATAEAAQQKGQTTVYRFTLPPNVAADRLTYASADAHAVFSRAADVERFATEQPDAKVPRQSEGIRLEQDGKGGAEHAVALGLGASPYPSVIRLSVQNGDDVSLHLQNPQLQMLERRVCFLPRPEVRYVFRYGDAALAAPRYDLSPLEAALPGASVSTLGPEKVLVAVTDAGAPFTERHRGLLWAALLLALGTLGYSAFRSARR